MFTKRKFASDAVDTHPRSVSAWIVKLRTEVFRLRSSSMWAASSSAASPAATPNTLTLYGILEHEVLGLLGLGMSNAQIAETLVISEKTAGHHVSRILAKLGVRIRAEAAAVAARSESAATSR